MDPNFSPNIILTGFMATGKSTIGRLLASALGYEFVDTDDLIENRYGKSIADIFDQDGEAVFRKREARVARELGQRQGLVIATGGGMMQNPANVDAFNRQGQIYCLSASLDQIVERIHKDKDAIRPLVRVDNPKQRIQELMLARQSVYDQFIQLDTTDKSPEQVVEDLLAIHCDKTNS